MKYKLFEIILFSIEKLLSVAPELFIELQQVFTKQNVTIEDFTTLRAEIASKSYKDLVPNTKIPPEKQT